MQTETDITAGMQAVCSTGAVEARESAVQKEVKQLMHTLADADAVVVGVGAGLSAAAGLTYDGPRFETYFADFIEKYGVRDMYSAGFYPYNSPEEYWAYWSRHIYWNRYDQPVGEPYQQLLELVRHADYFVITTNVDHCFQNAGFDRQRLFYTQGDYGLWQCAKPCHTKTYQNEAAVRQMVARQKNMRIPNELVPRCPVCGGPMTMNLRCDDTFVEDAGWHRAAARYTDFLRRHTGMRILFWELGVGANTPGIIKYPFWRMTRSNPKATYACVNWDAAAPHLIADQAICIRDEIGRVLTQMTREGEQT